MSHETEYETLSVSPVLGARYLFEFITFDIYVRELITQIYDYNYETEEILDKDARLTLDIDISNMRHKLNPRDASAVKLSISGGRSDLAPKGHLISTCKMKGVVAFLSYVRIIPRANIYYTASAERFHWSYVYDSSLLGFPDDFTASKWKNTAGIDIEYELSHDFFFAGIFANSGAFKNENKEWEKKTGGGIKGELIYKKMSLDIYFAWDLSKGPAHGGLYVLAGSRF